MNCTARTLGLLVLCIPALSWATSYSGGNGKSQTPYVISTIEDWQELIATPDHWSLCFELANDIDFKGLNLTPIAPDTDPDVENFQGLRFTGRFDGQGFVLKNAAIVLPDQDCVGLFGSLDKGAQILNLGIENITVIGRSSVGGLVGLNFGGTIRKCFTTGSVSGSHPSLTQAGGLVGVTTSNGIITDSYSTCTVVGVSRVGGLTGQLGSGQIWRCYATGHVSANGENIGGLTGIIYNPTSSGMLSNSFATGNVSGGTNVGGLVGNNYRGKVVNCYSVGNPTGTSAVGGLCGLKTIGAGYQDLANFWDTQTSQTADSAMGLGRTTAQMKTQSMFTSSGWDFLFMWQIVESQIYPQFIENVFEYSGGSGTAETPYQIADIDAWQRLLLSPTDWDKHFILTADIDFGGMELIPVAGNTSDVDIPKDTVPSFSGNFDGQRFSLINFVINQPNKRLVGLFGHIGATGQISNLGVQNISVTGYAYVGGLVGLNNGTLSDCHTAGSVALSTQPNQGMSHWGGLAGANEGTINDCFSTCDVSAYLYVGGLVGTNFNTINRSYATGTVAGYYYIGGLCGQNTSSRTLFSAAINNSFATGSVSGNVYIGGLVGSNTQGHIVHCYSTGKPTGLDFVGGLCGIRRIGVTADIDNFWDIQSSETQYSAMGVGKTTAQMKTPATFLNAGWDFVMVWYLPPNDYPRLGIWIAEYSGGIGSEVDPFQISTIEDWLKLIDTPMHWNRSFVLVNDIDFEGLFIAPVASDNDPLVEGFQGTPFTGKLDGQGYVLKNTALALPEQDCVGLFGRVGPGGRILNLGIENISVSGRAFVGGLCGQITGGTITSCFTTGIVNATASDNSWAGGLVGVVNQGGILYDCYSTAAVSGGSRVGGLAGQLAAGDIRRCHAKGTVIATGDNVGGLTGIIYDPITPGTLTSSYATSSVYGRTNVGGLCGQNIGGTITNCFTTGSVNAAALDNSCAGGLVGMVSQGGIVYDCYSTAAVSGGSRVGGLAGQLAAGDMRRCYAKGNVIATGDNVGGLVGIIYDPDVFGQIRNCYATGNVAGNTNVGGLIGQNIRGDVIHCYSTGVPTGNSAVGGLCGAVTTGSGYQDTGNYWDIETAITDNSEMGIGKTTAQLKSLATFVPGWNFDVVWWMVNQYTYPMLWFEAVSTYSGGNGTDIYPFRISTVKDWFELLDTPIHWSRSFVLANNIDFEGLFITPVAPDRDPFVEGFQGTPFTGKLDGQGYVLKNTVLVLPDQDCVGLFGRVGPGGQILNLGMENITVSGRTFVGGLCGQNTGGTIINCFTAGNINATSSGNSWVGGLVGVVNQGGIVYDCYSTAAVSGGSRVGGLAGQLAAGDMRRCYAKGNVIATGDNVGGLVGIIYDPDVFGQIRNCYATGNVAGNTNVGGLIGQNIRGDVIHCYSTGVPTGNSAVGGLCGAVTTGSGYQDTGNYWDIETAITDNSEMGIGKTTAQLKSLATFVPGWNFDVVWAMCEGANYPRLQWQVLATDWLCPDGVNIEDLLYFADHWLMTNCAAAKNCDGADLNTDGTVNLADWTVIASQWLGGI